MHSHSLLIINDTALPSLASSIGHMSLHFTDRGYMPSKLNAKNEDLSFEYVGSTEPHFALGVRPSETVACASKGSVEMESPKHRSPALEPRHEHRFGRTLRIKL